MKKIALSLIMFFITLLMVKADDNKIPIKSEIKTVTVFLSGAQVARTASATLPIGQSILIFEGLSQYVNPNSIQVKGTGDFTILSVTSQMDYMKTQEKPKEVIVLEDSLDSYNTQLDYQQSLLDIYKEEKDMIIANQSIGGTTVGVKVEELKAAADFFRTRLSDIKTKELAANAKIKKIKDAITQVTQQQKHLSAKPIPTSKIIVVVTSKTSTDATFEISYTVTKAGWTPFYDLRATDTNSPIALSYHANISQTTGEDWKNVKIKLSTGNPQQNGTKPSINPWYLHIKNESNASNEIINVNSANSSALMSGSTAKKHQSQDANIIDNSPDTDNPPATTAADYTTVNTNTTNFEFDISLPYTINSDGKTTIVEIQNLILPATYQYYCAPKLDPTAFLLAQITGWEDYNLLSGSINLYFEGTYVGKSNLDVKNTKDTLDFSLGRDENIVIERKKQKEYNSSKFLGENRNESFAWEINVRNKKKTPVTIVVEDQIPLSTDKQIEIEKEETSNAKFDEITGILSWKLNLKSAETQSIKFSYSVKYPKDKIMY
jgi:uncharacterized protein (TIGR02231 family)